MTRTTVTFSVSVPPEMAAELEEIRKKEHRTRSELIREALRRYTCAATDPVASDEHLFRGDRPSTYVAREIPI